VYNKKNQPRKVYEGIKPTSTIFSLVISLSANEEQDLVQTKR